jgi:aspartyl/asparaginyl beta-hydroxylase (cupin superfamily)
MRESSVKKVIVKKKPKLFFVTYNKPTYEEEDGAIKYAQRNVKEGNSTIYYVYKLVAIVEESKIPPIVKKIA